MKQKITMASIKDPPKITTISESITCLENVFQNHYTTPILDNSQV